MQKGYKMDWNKLQHTLFELDPVDPREDLRKLAESAGSDAQKSATPDVNYVQESVEVQKGTMPVEGDYSLSDFAALAGVTLNESQKTGSAGQAKAKGLMPKAEPGRTKHPLKDKLVGEEEIDEISARDAIKRGWDNHNTMGAVGLGKDDIANMVGLGSGGSKSKPSQTSDPTKTKAEPAARGSSWRDFLKQHTATLQKVAANPKKKAEFDQFMSKMSEELEEENKGLYHNVNKRKKAGTSRSKDHPKAPTDKAWKDAAKTAKTESVESIKEMLYRKLKDK